MIFSIFLPLVISNNRLYLTFQRGGRDKVNVGIRAPYLRIVGIKVDTDGPGRSTGSSLTPQEEDEFRHLAANPNIYDVVTKSIAPSIFGSTDMKRSIACLLFGGSRKRFVKDLKFGILAEFLWH